MREDRGNSRKKDELERQRPEEDFIFTVLLPDTIPRRSWERFLLRKLAVARRQTVGTPTHSRDRGPLRLKEIRMADHLWLYKSLSHVMFVYIGINLSLQHAGMPGYIQFEMQYTPSSIPPNIRLFHRRKVERKKQFTSLTPFIQ